MSSQEPAQKWNADQYARNAHFVPALGQPVLDLLAPRAGERILDLGCGDGVLTEKIVSAGASVAGVDASAEMIAAAQQRGLEVAGMDGCSLRFTHQFDAVFSNAAIHWMKSDPDAVIAGVRRALKSGGRFVAELGGHGCVAAISVAMLAVLQRRGVSTENVIPWYFPTVDDYRGRLERGGFSGLYRVNSASDAAPDRDGRLARTFGAPLFKQLPAPGRTAARDEVIALLRPALCDGRGRWTADYIRLRFAAHLPA